LESVDEETASGEDLAFTTEESDPSSAPSASSGNKGDLEDDDNLFDEEVDTRSKIEYLRENRTC
jgi:hypothetical protein